MRKLFNKVPVRLDGAAFLLAALLLLVLPLKWICAAAAAAVWHELCHWIAVKMCGGSLLRVRIGSGGTLMEAEAMAPWKEIICSLAGPLGGLLLLLLAEWFPRTAFCAAVQSAYNLLPLFPMDGGRAMRCGAAILFQPAKAQRLCAVIECVIKSAIAAAGIYGTFCLKLGLIPVLISVFLLLKTKSEKSLAN